MISFTTAERRPEAGFTLIELLVVVVILGILAAIAIPAFLNQRQDAFDAAAVSDLRNLIAIETGILTSTGAFTEVKAEIEAEDWIASDNVMACARTSNAGRDIALAAWHTDGGTLFSWSSSTTLTSAVVAPVPADCAAAIAPGAQPVS